MMRRGTGVPIPVAPTCFRATYIIRLARSLMILTFYCLKEHEFELLSIPDYLAIIQRFLNCGVNKHH